MVEDVAGFVNTFYFSFRSVWVWREVVVVELQLDSEDPLLVLLCTSVLAYTRPALQGCVSHYGDEN